MASHNEQGQKKRRHSSMHPQVAMASNKEHKDLKRKRSLPSIPASRPVTRRESSGTVQPDDLEHLSKISPGILAQLKAVEYDNTLTRGLVEDIRDAKTSKKSTVRMKSGKQLEIELVENSFRRISGMSDQSDTSGTFVVRTVEIKKEARKSLGFYIREGDGWNRKDGIFVSRVKLGSVVEANGLLHVGDEILKVNNVEITKMPLEDVVVVMQYVQKLVLTVKVLTSIPLSRTWSLRKHPSRSSFIQRQRDSLGDSFTHQPPVNDTKLSNIPHFQLDTADAETSIHPYEVVEFSTPRNKPDTGTESLPKSPDDIDTPDPLYEVVKFPPPPQAKKDKLDAGTVTTEGFPKSPTVMESPNESLATSGGDKDGGTSQQEDVEFTEFQVEDIQPPNHESTDQPPKSEPYSGMVSATVHHVDNLDANTGGMVSLTISVDSSAKVQSEIQTHAKIEKTFRIGLIQNSKLAISLRRDEDVATRNIHLSQIFPSKSDQTTRNIFLKVNPIGRIKVTFEYQPMTMAIPRMNATHSAHNPAAFTPSNPMGLGLPLSIERCVEIIEQHGLETHGLYHICASEAAKDEALSITKSQTKTRETINKVVSKVSVHAFTGVLKDFFRNLPEPLLTSSLYSELIEAAKIPDSKMMAEFIECLPEEVTPTLNLLLGHFRRVCEHSAANGMTADKLGKIFGPFLFAPTLSDGEILDSYATDFDSQANIIRILMETPPST